MNYARMLKTFGNYTNSQLVNPKIFKRVDFIFPKGSMLVWLDYTIKYIPEPNTGLLKNTTKPSLFLYDTLDNPVPDSKRNNVNPKSILTMLKRDTDTIKFINASRALVTPFTTMLIANPSLMDDFYKYKNTPVSDYNRFLNVLTGAIEIINSPLIGVGRQKFLTIEVPLNIPNYTEMEKFIKLSPKALLNKTKDKRTLLLVELYKWLDPDSDKRSIFSKVNEEVMKNTNLVFTFNDKAILVNMYDFKALNKDYHPFSKVKGFNGNKARKILLAMFISLSIREPLTISELSDPKKIDTTMKLAGDDIDVDELLNSLEEDKPAYVEEKEEVDLVNIEVKPIEDIMSSKPVNTKSTALDNLTLAYDRGELTSTQFKKQKERLDKQADIDKELQWSEDEIKLINPTLSDNPVVFDKSMLKDTVGSISKTYMKKSYDKNIQRAIYGIQSSGHVVTDVIKETEETILGGTEIYKIKIAPADKVPVTVTIRIPKLDENGEFKVGGNEYSMRHQRGDVPIKKVKPEEVILASYYGKLSIQRDKYAKNSTPIAWLRQLKKDELVTNLIEGDAFTNQEDLPYEYTLLSKVVKSFYYGKTYFMLSYKTRHLLLGKNVKLEDIEKKGILIGREGLSYLVIDKDNNLYKVSAKDTTELGNLSKYINIDKKMVPPQVAYLRIYSTFVPLGVIMLHKYTFSQLLKLTKVEHTKIPYKRGIRLADDEYSLTLDDYIYIFKKTDRKNSMLFGGLAEIKAISNISLKNLDNIHGFQNIAGILGYDKSLVTEVKNIFNLFVDPITTNILTLMKEPTHIDGLFLRALELLLTDYSPDPTSLDFQRLMGDERVAGLMYKQLAKAIRGYESKKQTSRAKITVNPYELWQTIIGDSTTVLVNDLNPISLLKQTEDVTYTGAGGRNKETMTKASRSLHETDIGVVSESVKDNTDVGITAYLSADPLLDGTTGLKKKDTGELSKANIYSPTTMLFADNDKDDPKRSNFTSVQNDHVTPMTNQMVLPVRTGYEAVIPRRMPEKYVVSARMAGKVTSVDDKSIVIKYDDKEEKTYPLKEWFSKQVGGVTYKHTIVANFKKGDKFEEGDTIAYDNGFFGKDMFNPKQVILKMGQVVRTMYVEDPDTFEDSISLSRYISPTLSVPTTKIRTLTIPMNKNIVNVRSIGDKASALEPLFIIVDELSDELDAGKKLNFDEKTLDVLSELNNSAPKSKYDGNIVKIECFYNGDMKDMSPSIRKLAKASNDRFTLDNGSAMTGKVDGGYSIEGKPLQENHIAILYYIEKIKDGTTGDKYIFGNQLKGTVSTLFGERKTESDRIIEAEFSTIGEGARIVNSADLTGVKTTILREASLRASKM